MPAMTRAASSRSADCSQYPCCLRFIRVDDERQAHGQQEARELEGGDRVVEVADGPREDEDEPLAALAAKAYQVHGSSRRIISLTFWFGVS